MRFRFYPKESKIIDLITFPSILNFLDKDTEESSFGYYDDYISSDVIEHYESIASKLKPFEKEIDKFYFLNLSLPVLITKEYSIFGYGSIEEYLNFIKSLSEKDLLKSILYKIYAIISDDDRAMNPTNHDEIIFELLTDKNKQIALLNDLDVTDEVKWKLSAILLQPRVKVDEWITLIEKINPLFEIEYQKKEAKILDFGNQVEKKLNDSNGADLESMTDNLLNKNLLTNGNILVSLVNSFALEINSSDKVSYLRWGIDVEDFLEIVQNAKENQLKERVLLFKNLGDKTRYEVIRLVAQGAVSAKEIATILNVSQATISYHLNNLISSKILILERNNSKYSHKVNFDILESAYKSMIEDFTPK